MASPSELPAGVGGRVPVENPNTVPADMVF